MSTKLQKTKFAALVTYVIVLACMIASLFVPFFGDGTMLIKELPDAFKIVTGLNFSLPSFFTTFSLTSYFTVYNAKLNLAAVAVVAYGVVIVLGLLALIPICAGKKHSKMPRVIIYIIEILAMLSLLLFLYDRATMLSETSFYSLRKNNQVGYPLLAMMVVIWLFLTIQSTNYKKGSGIVKSLLFLFSGAAVVCLFGRVYDVVVLRSITSFAGKINASGYFIGDTSGYALVNDLGATIGSGLTNIFALATALLVLVNLVIDTFALTVTSYKAGKVFNLVRYGAELILAIVTAIMGAVNGVSAGIWLYILMIVVLVEIIISTIRMFTHASADDDDDTDDDTDDDDDDDTDDEDEEETVEVVDKNSAMGQGFYEASSSTNTQPPVYTRAYTYQDDGFLNSLTPGERAEFYAVFIDKRRGSFYFLPDYQIGGDNKEFFQALFIYLGKFMGTLSDGLMNKIYRRLNILD